jgi:hypothetical protein
MREMREVPRFGWREVSADKMSEGMGDLLDCAQRLRSLHFAHGGRDGGLDGVSLTQ